MAMHESGGAGVLERPRRRRGAAPPPPPQPPGDGDGDGWGGDRPDPPPPPGEPGKEPGTARLGLRLALAWVGGLFLVLLALAARARGADAPPPVPPALGVATALLALSSACLALAARRADRAWLRASLLCGGGFVAGQGLAGLDLVRGGVLPSSGLAAASAYALIGLHLLHVLVGLAVLGRLVASPRPGTGAVRLAAAYWHFMGLVWVAALAVVWWPR